MKRVALGAHLPIPWSLNLPNAPTIEPTIAWAAVFPSANVLVTAEWTGTRPLVENGVGQW